MPRENRLNNNNHLIYTSKSSSFCNTTASVKVPTIKREQPPPAHSNLRHTASQSINVASRNQAIQSSSGKMMSSKTLKNSVNSYARGSSKNGSSPQTISIKTEPGVLVPDLQELRSSERASSIAGLMSSQMSLDKVSTCIITLLTRLFLSVILICK